MKEKDPAITEWNYPVTKILLLRSSMTEVLRHEFEGRLLDEKGFARLADVVAGLLPGGDYDHPTIVESCRHLAGTIPTAAVLKAFAHRMAGNQPLLKRRRPVTPWVVQSRREWVPLQVTGVKRQFKEKTGPGGLFSFWVLAGTPVGFTIRKWWSLRYCRWISSSLRFSKAVSPNSAHPAKYPFGSVEHFVTLRLYGLIDPALCGHDSPMFHRIKVAPSLSAWNREQLRHRFRIDPGYTCPAGYPREFDCRRCPKGYKTCRAGTHASDYLFKPCEDCGDQFAPFDPDWVGAACVNCVAKANSGRVKDGG